MGVIKRRDDVYLRSVDGMVAYGFRDLCDYFLSLKRRYVSSQIVLLRIFCLTDGSDIGHEPFFKVTVSSPLLVLGCLLMAQL